MSPHEYQRHPKFLRELDGVAWRGLMGYAAYIIFNPKLAPAVYSIYRESPSAPPAARGYLSQERFSSDARPPGVCRTFRSSDSYTISTTALSNLCVKAATALWKQRYSNPALFTFL